VDHVDLASQRLFEFAHEVDAAPWHVGTLLERHEHIDITLRSEVIAQRRSEHEKFGDVMTTADVRQAVVVDL
jgi:hypothetical protein